MLTYDCNLIRRFQVETAYRRKKSNCYKAVPPAQYLSVCRFQLCDLFDHEKFTLLWPRSTATFSYITFICLFLSLHALSIAVCVSVISITSSCGSTSRLGRWSLNDAKHSQCRSNIVIVRAGTLLGPDLKQNTWIVRAHCRYTGNCSQQSVSTWLESENITSFCVIFVQWCRTGTLKWRFVKWNILSWCCFISKRS